MKRREFIQGVAVAPFVPVVVPRGTDTGEGVRDLEPNRWAGPNPPEPRPPLTADEMAARLWSNLQRYIAQDEVRHADKWDEAEKGDMRGICHEFSNALLDASRHLEFFQAVFPDADLTRLQNVRYEVMDYPLILRSSGEQLQAQARKLRCGFYNPDHFKDIQACYFDPTEEYRKLVGSEAARDVHIEILRVPERIQIYSIYLPPYLSPIRLPPGDWSVDRCFMFRYAKSYR